MQRKTWARTRSERRWWIGLTLRSTDLRERKARSTGEVLVGADGLGGVEALGLDVGADDVEAVELFFGGDLFAEPFEGEGVVGDVGLEVLGDLVAVDDLADADADVILSAEGAPFALGGRLDGFEKSFGGAEEFVALTAALGGEAGVAADDEALASRR